MEKGKIKRYSVIPAAILLFGHGILYKISAPIADRIGLLTYVPKIPALDDRIPIIPAFIIIYVLAYVFWFLCPIINSMARCERYADYLVGFAAAYVIGFVLLCLFPAVMDRNAEGIVESLGSDIFSRLHLWFITVMDGGDIAHGLLPSYHSLSSAYCCFGVMRCREIPKGWRAFVLIYAVGVVLSTLFLKQHYIMDAVAGISVAAMCYALARKFHWGRCLIPLLTRLNGE